MVVKGIIYPYGDYQGFPDVKITEVGTSNMTKTDTSGNFSLLILNPMAMIEIFKSGYKKQTMLASAFNNFATLMPDFENPIDIDPIVIHDDQRNNTMLYVGIGVAAVAGLYFATRKKPQKVKVY